MRESEIKVTILALLRDGYTTSMLADYFNKSESTIDRWLHVSPRFELQVKEAREAAKAKLLSTPFDYDNTIDPNTRSIMTSETPIKRPSRKMIKTRKGDKS